MRLAFLIKAHVRAFQALTVQHLYVIVNLVPGDFYWPAQWMTTLLGRALVCWHRQLRGLAQRCTFLHVCT